MEMYWKLDTKQFRALLVDKFESKKQAYKKKKKKKIQWKSFTLFLPYLS